ncbi:OmpA family protein [Pseudogemmobacter faecipullorum]|uniref:OmpA family protein n=1 Tax=Pseudogemmobacter faecipullorum TaxID=2755041 RepID=A0ABS8CM91_9RHOB|nr:OmpA family protein [Pseudogemmobacter faecipullorum]MCB5410496.1 OmpA family protein [Pseudogemmobacter faecipullorum]
MRKILISTTALSVALTSFQTLPVVAQDVAEDPAALSEQLLQEQAAQAEAEAAAAAEAAAQAEAEAQAEAAAAAEAAAQAEAEARAEAEAAAQAEADAAAQAAAEAEAKAQAEAESAAAAATEAAAQAEAEAAAAEAAAAEAAAQAEVEAQAQAEAAAQAAAEAAAQAEAEAEAVPAEEAPVEMLTETPAVTPAVPAAEPEAEEPSAPLAEAPAEPAAEPVDAPVVEAEAAEVLSGLLAEPTAIEAGNEAVTAEGNAAEAGIVTGLPAAAGFLETGAAGSAEGATAVAPASVVETLITPETARSSEQEFAAAPVEVSKGKKSGLSDLEKVGLVALGALAIGTVISSGNKAEERRVVSNSGDRVVVENPDGSYVVYKDDDAVLRRPGVRTSTESFNDGSTRTVVTREDGTQVVTVRNASGRVLRRSAYDRQGVEMVLFDDLYAEEPIRVSELPRPHPDRVVISTSDRDAALKAELAAEEAERLGRKFSLRQIREIREVRELAATVEVDSITFDTGSSVIRATEARKLAELGRLMGQLLDSNPRHVFLIEGHTDAVGSASSNLLLSDRRAESLALALTEYFDVPPENLVVQGYGESELKIRSQEAERANRRVNVRLITPLLRKF